MSDRAALRTAVQRRLGNRTAELTTADIDRFIDDGLLDLGTLRVHLRNLERVGAPISSAVGVSGYPKASDVFTLLYLVDTVNKKVLHRWSGTFESFLEAQQSESPDATTIPESFVEFADKFFVHMTPQVTTISWTPHEYIRPSLGAAPTAIPNIDTEWHFAIGIIAAIHGFSEIGDEERKAAATNEFKEWLSLRDTPRRMATRFAPAVSGARPHPSLHSRRTGV